MFQLTLLPLGLGQWMQRAFRTTETIIHESILPGSMMSLMLLRLIILFGNGQNITPEPAGFSWRWI
jgi:hypothetical protein